ncbi:MAG: Clp protease N-terminal domain-containing protein, partial [Actinomycetota bacterium]
RVSEQALRDFVATLASASPKRSLAEGSFFSKFTVASRKVVVLAQERARDLGHRYIGAEHLLLGVLSLDDAIGAQALASMGASIWSLTEQVLEIIGRGEDVRPIGHIPFTPRAKTVFELALREAQKRADVEIGVDHLTLALLLEEDGVPAVAMRAAGAGYAELSSAIDKTLAAHPGITR